jgi:acyl carrier protein
MLARLTVSDREFVARYFRCEQVSSEVAVQVRRIFAEFTELPVQTILPDDDFRAYLLDNEFEMATVLEHAFKLTIPDSDAAKMRATVRSVSIVMAELVRRKQAIERVERQPSRPS